MPLIITVGALKIVPTKFVAMLPELVVKPAIESVPDADVARRSTGTLLPQPICIAKLCVLNA